MTLTRFQSQSSEQPATAAPKLHVVTFGCQMNKYDSLLVEGRFKKSGYGTTDQLNQADVVVFNTCSVRDHAEERVYSWLGELRREKERRPDLVIGVMGCMAQRVEDELFRRAGHVDIVCGTRQFQHLPELVSELRARRADPQRFAGGARLLATDTQAAVEVEREGETYTGGRHGFLAVMRGCDLSCSFCIVPTVRGPVQSRPIDDLVREARWMVEQGCQVITLLGQTVNSYGEDMTRPAPGEPRYRGRQGRPSLADLLYALQEIEGLERIRLITLHAAYVTRELAVALRECDKCDRFLPLPAQHGSDRILKAMKRGYTLDLYRKRLEILREEVPDIELGSDWIVGFCGESEADYVTCEDFLEEVGFVVNYVFKYDPRPTTRAADRLPDDVPDEIKQERNRRLLAAAERTQLQRFRAHVGRREPVFVESLSDKHPGKLRGRTMHGLPCSFELAPAHELAQDASLEDWIGRRVDVDLEEASPYGLAGKLAPDAGRAP